MIRNPYRDEYVALMDSMSGAGARSFEDLYRLRAELIGRYAFAIPDERTLALLAAHSPIVEIGAGNGYWAWCLSQAGADIVAIDLYPPGEARGPFFNDADNTWFDDEWLPVIAGDTRSAGSHPGRTLFLCWPDPRGFMARDALASYRAAGGRRLVYIGDPASSGDADFHATLASLPCLDRFRTDGWEMCDEWCALYDAS